jgi:hypothetical protein
VDGGPVGDGRELLLVQGRGRGPAPGLGFLKVEGGDQAGLQLAVLVAQVLVGLGELAALLAQQESSSMSPPTVSIVA